MPIHAPFPHAWTAEVLHSRPLILPPRHFTYPAQVEEVERGALEVMISPRNGDSFLATFALGFRDPIVPTGLWSAPNPEEICALSGGYAYIISVHQPERFVMLSMRPVLAVHAAPEAALLLFVGHRDILAWGAHGKAWHAESVSSEGISIDALTATTIRGTGWEICTDQEFSFTLDLATGQRIGDS